MIALTLFVFGLLSSRVAVKTEGKQRKGYDGVCDTEVCPGNEEIWLEGNPHKDVHGESAREFWVSPILSFESAAQK